MKVLRWRVERRLRLRNDWVIGDKCNEVTTARYNRWYRGGTEGMGTEHLCSGTLSCHVFRVCRGHLMLRCHSWLGLRVPRRYVARSQEEEMDLAVVKWNWYAGRGKCSENFFVKLATKKDQHWRSCCQSYGYQILPRYRVTVTFL